MKNREEFERFAALYLQQVVLLTKRINKPILLKGMFIDILEEYDCLQLRSIESLTDEEWLNVMELEGLPRGSESIENLKRGIFLDLDCHCIRYSIIDYWRSIGIAVPFMNYSVEDMVNMGWIKLKQESK